MGLQLSDLYDDDLAKQESDSNPADNTDEASVSARGKEWDPGKSQRRDPDTLRVPHHNDRGEYTIMVTRDDRSTLGVDVEVDCRGEALTV